MSNRSINGTDCSSYPFQNTTDSVRCVGNDDNYPRPLASVILDSIQRNYYPFLIILGCVGNILSICVFATTKLRKFSSSYYLSALAISDTFFLLNVAIKWLDVLGISLFGTNFICQMLVYTTYVFSFVSVQLVVLFTIERFVAVRYPLHRPAVCTVARAKLFITLLLIFALFLYSPYLLMAAPQSNDQSNNCSTAAVVCALVPRYRTLAYYYNHLDVIATLIIPFCTIFVLNLLICRSVHDWDRIRRTMTFSRRRVVSNRNSAHRSSSGQVTQMLLVVSTVFIILNLPSYIFRLWLYIQEYYAITSFDDELMSLLQQYSNVLFDTNFAINFVLYCISGQNFRRALTRLFCPRRTRRRQEFTQATDYSRVMPIPNTNQSVKNASNGSFVELHSIKKTYSYIDSSVEMEHTT